MSCPHIVWALREGRERRLKATERLVLMVLAERANGQMYCWPSIGTIAEDTGLSGRAVQFATAHLEKIGLIRIERRFRQTSIYHVLRPKEDEHPSPKQDERDSPLRPEGESDASARVNQTTIEGESGSQNPPKESPKEEPLQPRARARGRTRQEEKDDIAFYFDLFWNDYPRKIGKGAAFKAFAKAFRAVGYDPIIDALDEAIDDDHRFQSKQYTPHPATWLNAGPWMVPPPPAPERQGSLAMADRS